MYKGEIEGFPVEVVEKMLEHQVEQGNKRDVSVFEIDCTASRKEGGFNWSETPERWSFWADVIFQESFDLFFEQGRSFWREVIGKKNFDLFFEHYPKDNVKSEEQPEQVKNGTTLPIDSVSVKMQDGDVWVKRDGKVSIFSKMDTTIEELEQLIATYKQSF